MNASSNDLNVHHTFSCFSWTSTFPDVILMQAELNGVVSPLRSFDCHLPVCGISETTPAEILVRRTMILEYDRLAGVEPYSIPGSKQKPRSCKLPPHGHV